MINVKSFAMQFHAIELFTVSGLTLFDLEKPLRVPAERSKDRKFFRGAAALDLWVWERVFVAG
jgi:hypothetical protein